MSTHDDTTAATPTAPAKKWPVIAGCAALIAALAAAVITGTQLLSVHATDNARTDALAAATSLVPDVLSYDFNSAEQSLTAVSGSLTGEFRDQFRELTKSVIVPAAKKDSIVTTATVAETAVVSVDRDHVTVLMFLNQRTTSSRFDGEQLDGSRVRASLDNIDGQWLISELTPV